MKNFFGFAGLMMLTAACGSFTSNVARAPNVPQRAASEKVEVVREKPGQGVMLGRIEVTGSNWQNGVQCEAVLREKGKEIGASKVWIYPADKVGIGEVLFGQKAHCVGEGWGE